MVFSVLKVLLMETFTDVTAHITDITPLCGLHPQQNKRTYTVHNMYFTNIIQNILN